MIVNELKKMHDNSVHNETQIMASSVCGCFHCGRIFKPSQIKDFLKEKEGRRTAICPYCGIDSVIGSASGAEITSEFLKDMYNMWFKVE